MAHIDLAPYPAAVAADEAWSAEGQRLFGARWGDVRYTPRADGEPGTELRRLYEEWRAALDALDASGIARHLCVPSPPGERPR